MFSNKSKAANTKWKIKIFKQSKKHIADFIIKFEALAMKAEIGNIHAIFLLKKNIGINIIKTILGYLPITILETLREWKVAIILVGQEYEYTESQNNYKMSTRTIYRRRGIHIDIGKAKDNLDKDGRPKCFNCNTYRYMAKKCQRLKKEKKNKKVL